MNSADANDSDAVDLAVPIFLLNDTKLVDSNDDLWDGTLDVPLSITEEGNPRGGGAAWGFRMDGNFNDWSG